MVSGKLGDLMKASLFLAAPILLTFLAVAGCDSKVPTSDMTSNSSNSSSSADATKGASPTPETSKTPEKAPTATPGGDAAKGDEPAANDGGKAIYAILDTNYGKIKIKLRSDVAPNTVKNFVKLAKKKFYDGTKFHRVIPGFMIQGGDPLSKGKDRSVMGTGDPGYKVKAEFNDLSHKRGVVSMARAQDPDSAGSQFFIVVADSVFLDHQYTAFGEVVSGMDVADKIVNLPRDPRDNPNPENPAIVKHVTIEGA